MIIVIDAYNLLKQRFQSDISDEEKSNYIQMLNKYARKKKHKVVLIFDGGYFAMPSREKIGQVIIIYPGRDKSADDAIKEYLYTHKNKDLVLVSSDRELVDYADEFDIVSIDSLAFDSYIEQAVQKPTEQTIISDEQIYKLHPEQINKELDLLMQEASQVLIKKPEEDEFVIKKESSLSKKERKVMAILKKL
ncbi:MAG: NYN domain-containing protein [Candidatus Babeliales bacterium]